jgi:hypothetical protein
MGLWVSHSHAQTEKGAAEQQLLPLNPELVSKMAPNPQLGVARPVGYGLWGRRGGRT